MPHWRHLFYADADYGDAMAQSFIAQVDHLSRSDPAAAVYRERSGRGAAHYYFSPAASQIAQRFFATPCSGPPALHRLERVAGRIGETAT